MAFSKLAFLILGEQDGTTKLDQNNLTHTKSIVLKQEKRHRHIP